MRCGSGRVPDGAWVAGRVVDAGQVGYGIKQLLARTEITGQRAMVAVNDAMATFRVLHLEPTVTDAQVSAAVARELTLDPAKFNSRWTQVGRTRTHRVIYAAAWDRAALKSAADAVRFAGVDPDVIELKSAAVARAVIEPSCVIVDLVSRPADLILIDGSVPHTWHGFDLKVSSADELTAAVAGPVRSVIRFHRRKSGVTFGSESPVLISAEQTLPSQALLDLSAVLEQPVRLLPAPPRVPANVRHSIYLACIGLVMRRES